MSHTCTRARGQNVENEKKNQENEKFVTSAFAPASLLSLPCTIFVPLKIVVCPFSRKAPSLPVLVQVVSSPSAYALWHTCIAITPSCLLSLTFSLWSSQFFLPSHPTEKEFFLFSVPVPLFSPHHSTMCSHLRYLLPSSSYIPMSSDTGA